MPLFSGLFFQQMSTSRAPVERLRMVDAVSIKARILPAVVATDAGCVPHNQAAG
jgi:hypothetical protein